TTPSTAMPAPTTVPVATWPESKAGATTRPVTAPITNAVLTVIPANSALPTAATANLAGCSRTAVPSRRRPRARTSADGLGTGALLGGSWAGGSHHRAGRYTHPRPTIRG